MIELMDALPLVVSDTKSSVPPFFAASGPPASASGKLLPLAILMLL
jgi:hypothetical protein